MTKAPLSAAAWGLSAIAAGVLLAGCSFSAGAGDSDPKLAKDKLAAEVSEKLAAQTGRAKPDVTCPEDLAGKVGTTTRCMLTADDNSTLGVAVKVTSVEGETVNFDMKADEKASPGGN